MQSWNVGHGCLSFVSGQRNKLSWLRNRKESRCKESEFSAASLVKIAELMALSGEDLEKRNYGFGRLFEICLFQ